MRLAPKTMAGSSLRQAGKSAALAISETPVKAIAIVAVLTLIAFLAGYVTSWLTTNVEMRQLRSESQFFAIRQNLAAAALNAENARYEDAREFASRFFTMVRAELDSEVSVLDAGSKETFEKFLADRDDVITTLARGDPSSAEILFARYLEVEKISKVQQDGSANG